MSENLKSSKSMVCIVPHRKNSKCYRRKISLRFQKTRFQHLKPKINWSTLRKTIYLQLSTLSFCFFVPEPVFDMDQQPLRSFVFITLVSMTHFLIFTVNQPWKLQRMLHSVVFLDSFKQYIVN